MTSGHSTLRELLQIIGKRQRIIVTVFFTIVGIVVIGSLLATPIYEGTVKIIIERAEQSDLTGEGRRPFRDPDFEQTQFQLIKSHAVSKRVVALLGLEDQYETLQKEGGRTWLRGLKSSITNWVSSLLPSGTDAGQENPVVEGARSKEDLVAKALARNISVRPIEGSKITSIKFRSPNPDFAALAANTYVQAYLEVVLDIKMDATRRNLEWMTQKAETEQLKLGATEKQLQEYMEAHDLVTLEDRITILPERLAQLGRDLVRAETTTKEHKLLYDKVQAVSNNLNAAESVLSISEGASLDVLRAQILRAEQNIMELSSKFGRKHPTMQKAVADLEVLKQKRRQEIRRIIQKVRGQYELALSNENSIRAKLNETKAEALELNQKFVKYSELKREIETNKHLYDALLTKIKEQSITGETKPVNIWIVESAKVPKNPVFPIMSFNIILSIIIGLGCSVITALLVDNFDNRIKSTSGLEDILGVAVLGGVGLNKSAEAMREISRTDPRSEFAESYNALRTTLMLTTPETPPKRILVTSSVAGEGKTTTAINLALAMAKAGSRVVLLDGDMRKPNVHKVFNINRNNGLSNYLVGSSSASLLNKSTHENLVVMSSGRTPPNPYELLNSNRMAALLEKLEREFDMIICDTPPVLSVADSRVLSRMFDGLILVTRAGLTSYPMAQNCIKSLVDVNARILGVFVNAIKESDQEDYYRYYKSYFEETKSKAGTTQGTFKTAVSPDK